MQAYGTLTIVDLLDTATYIYYADDAEGKNPSASPEGKKYIGIYSGPPVEGGQPNTPPAGTEWTKYVGEDGVRGTSTIKITSSLTSHTDKVNGITPAYRKKLADVKSESKVEEVLVGDIIEYSYYHYAVLYVDDTYVYCGPASSFRGSKGATGSAGRGIDHTVIEYGVSENGEDHSTVDWRDTIPTLNQGEYLWIRTTTHYTDGDSEESYSVSYSGIDGNDANTYYIETNQEEVLRFIESENTVFSPERLTFKIFNNPKQSNDQISLESNNYQLEIIINETIEPIRDLIRLGYTQITNNNGIEKSEEVDTDTVYFELQEYMRTFKPEVSSCLFRFSYLVDNNLQAIKMINLRNGVSEDMATFSVHARGITSAIQGTKLDFSEEGLKVYNGGIKILNNNGNEVFSGDKEGNLTLTGTINANSGTFHGTVYANDGEFNGVIKANSGIIGGLTIENNRIVGTSNEEEKLILNGNGTVYCQDITLGTGAKIQDYIKLGSAYIYNPTSNSSLFIKAGDIELTDNGILSLGGITISGVDNSIQGGIEGSSAFWKIKGDGRAQFKEIIVDKAIVKDSVFEIGTVQSVGSLMLFKDSWKIEEVDVENKTMTLTSSHNNINLEVNDYVTQNGKDFYKISAVNGKKITFENQEPLSAGNTITKLGKNGEYLFSILGGKQNEDSKDYKYANSNSLTISQIKIDEDGDWSFTNNLVLGKLPNDKGFGLLAENVFLNGTLTTKIENGKYAGVNTLKGVPTNKFEEYNLVRITESDYKKGQYYIFEEEYKICEEESFNPEKQYFTKAKIVFWAGSDGEGDNQIQMAPFQVTDAGSIYANKGIFEGALITKSTIKGASIHTAKIYGENDGNAAALQIYDVSSPNESDANRGIQFMKGDQVFLQIDSGGLKRGINQSIISITTDNGKEKISYYGDEINLTQINSTSLNQKIKFENDGIYFSFNNENSLIVQDNLIEATKNVRFNNNVYFGENNLEGSLEYQPVIGEYKGYDLFVR